MHSYKIKKIPVLNYLSVFEAFLLFFLMQCEDAVKSFLKAFAETCSGKKALHKIKSLKGER